MNTARQRVNDMQNDVNGDLLTNDAPYTQTLLTDAWTWLQDQCADNSIEISVDEVTLLGLPPRASDDPSNQAWVSWEGCSDGVNEYETPSLPQNVIVPLSIWRRSSSNVTGFTLMRQAVDGLPRWIDCWQSEWRNNALYFYGDTAPSDLLVRFSQYLPDLDALKPDDPVGIRGCKECLGSRIAFLFTNSRVPGGAGALSLQQMSETAFQSSLGSRTNKRKQRQTVRRRPYRSGGYGNPFPYVQMP